MASSWWYIHPCQVSVAHEPLQECEEAHELPHPLFHYNATLLQYIRKACFTIEVKDSETKALKGFVIDLLPPCCLPLGLPAAAQCGKNWGSIKRCTPFVTTYAASIAVSGSTKASNRGSAGGSREEVPNGQCE